MTLPAERERRAADPALSGSGDVTHAQANGTDPFCETEVVLYDYRDESERLLFQVVRTGHGKSKRIRQRRPKPGGGWAFNLHGVEPIPYNLSHVVEAVAQGEPVFVTEGEKDADALEALGLTATTNPMGAGKWRKEFNRWFHDADVIVVADKDDVGYKHAAIVQRHLSAVARSVDVVEAWEGKDAADHVQAGYEEEHFVQADPERLATARSTVQAKHDTERPSPATTSTGDDWQAWVQWAMRQLYRAVPAGSIHNGRSEVAFKLAQQLRDHGYSQEDAARAMRTFVDLAPPVGSEGEQFPYSLDEALATCRSTYAMPARQPWAVGRPDETHEDRVERALQRKRAERDADRLLAAEQWAATFKEPPSARNLTEELALNDEELRYRIADLHPCGANTNLAAQFKTGKTTLDLNLTLSLADGVPFLGRYEVTRPSGSIAYWNYEVSRQQFRAWLRRIGIVNTDSVVPLTLRGFRIAWWTAEGEDWIVRWLTEHGVTAWIVDPFARAFRGVGSENSNDDVGRFLDTLDVIKERAGVEDLFLSSHTGRAEHAEGEEHVRGATVLDDWADVRWVLTRDGERRYFRAEGRDVLAEAEGLTFDPSSQRLALSGATKHDDRLERASRIAWEVVVNKPGLGSRDLRSAMRGVDNNVKDHAIQMALAKGWVTRREEGQKQAHYPGDSRPEPTMKVTIGGAAWDA